MTPARTLRNWTVLTAAAVIGLAVTLSPLPSYAAGTDTPPPADEKKDKKKGSAVEQREQQLADAKFLRDYRAARELIVSGSYQAGIAAMHALGRDDHPDVANYIGYANRKAGNYDQSKVWYEAALKADPNHTRTWSYFGMWHMEQGNRLMAKDHLAKVSALCGNDTCEDYVQLKAVIDGTASY